LKSSRSSIDSNTISTFDSGDQSGFYRNYQQAWENLRFAGGSSSPAAYKPSSLGRNGLNGHHLHHHLEADTPFTRATSGTARTGGTGTYNEGFRDTSEVTLNADVAALYSTRNSPSVPGNNRTTSAKSNGYNNESQHWRKKY